MFNQNLFQYLCVANFIKVLPSVIKFNLSNQN
jgi:hypothetical protein